jgi:hypothetical protein
VTRYRNSKLNVGPELIIRLIRLSKSGGHKKAQKQKQRSG